MNRTDNIYIDSLRFGAANMATGITLNELTNHLSNLGWQLHGNFKPYFHYWFFTHFFHDNAYATLKNGNYMQVQGALRDVVNWADLRCPMTAEAYETFLDFEKLKQAQIDTRKAQRLANIAIWISGGLAFVQIVLQIIAMGIHE